MARTLFMFITRQRGHAPAGALLRRRGVVFAMPFHATLDYAIRAG